MKKILILLIATAGLLPAISQKTIHDENAEKRNVSGYHSIKISDGIDLYLSQGNESVAVSAASAEHRNRIRTVVENGVLKIWYEWKSNLRMDWKNRKLKAYVSVKQLEKLNSSGGSDILIDGIFRSEKTVLIISGGSDFSGKVDINQLTIDASGGSDVNISGKVKQLTIDASGGSDFNGYELSADFCKIKASGGSDVYITVNKELSANASGGSDVFYKGSGMIRDIKTSGSSVKRVSS